VLGILGFKDRGGKVLNNRIRKLTKSGIPKGKRGKSQCQLGVDHGVHASAKITWE
jgi:hypothetical protein